MFIALLVGSVFYFERVFVMVISIYKFLAVYYGILVDTRIKYTHAEAKYKFNFLKGCSFEYAENNPQLISCGEIILVIDKDKKVLPYYCPEFKNEFIGDRSAVKREHKILGERRRKNE